MCSNITLRFLSFSIIGKKRWTEKEVAVLIDNWNGETYPVGNKMQELSQMLQRPVSIIRSKMQSMMRKKNCMK